jgi:hypothetical protein
MKKILAILAMVASAGAFAASSTIEYQNIDGQYGQADQRNVNLTVRDEINSFLTGDVVMMGTWNNMKTANGNGASDFRGEAGLTGTTKIAGPVSGYTRVALGQKFTGYGNFAYYSVEPGVIVATPVTGLTASLGYRFRDAVNDTVANADQTRTIRAGLNYQLNAKNAIGLGYDQMRGDAAQNIVRVNYTRGF